MSNDRKHVKPINEGNIKGNSKRNPREVRQSPPPPPPVPKEKR